VRFSEHFERFRRHRPDRADITIEMCERIEAEPMKKQEQDKGRTAYWGYVPAKDRYLIPNPVVEYADAKETRVVASCEHTRVGAPLQEGPRSRRTFSLSDRMVA
jgi:hypothetical protein